MSWQHGRTRNQLRMYHLRRIDEGWEQNKRDNATNRLIP
eukprot:SAG25_NODE_9777_length_358_cov_0.965251_1_plen_38_part_01